MPWTETSTSSPTSIGPTPSGVPVRITSPGQQRHHAGDVGDQGGDVEDHVLGGAVLLDVAVEVGLHPQVADVELGLDPGAERAEGVEALGAGELHVLRCRSRAVTSLPTV